MEMVDMRDMQRRTVPPSTTTGANTPKTSHEQLRPRGETAEEKEAKRRSFYSRVFPLKVRAPPFNNEAPGVSEWLQTYLSAMLTVSVFGASITFTVVVSDLYDPSPLPKHNRATFSLATIRLFIALGWMFFTFAFGISAIALILYNNESLKYVPRHRWGFVDFMVKLMLPILSLSQILAFACLALAVAAYAPVVGWFVLGWTGLYFLVVIGLIIYVNNEGVSFLFLPELMEENSSAVNPP